MEIIVGLVVVVALGLLWHSNRKKAETLQAEAAPYKVEVAPVVETVVAEAAPVVVAVEGAGVVEVPAEKPAKKAPAKKPAAAKAKAPAKKPAPAKKAPAKKPAAPKKAK